jgi:hypothetical protein
MPNPAYNWCCLAEINASERVIVSKVSGFSTIDQPAFQTVEGFTLDITESPGWMEYLERKEHRMNDDEGGAGAYDTMRCDLLTVNDDSADRWRIWGQEFHLKRLQQSFETLLIASKTDDVLNLSFARAMQQSQAVMEGLLAEAESSDCLCHSPCNETEEPTQHDFMIRLVRLTLLWSLDITEKPQILVRGHACSTAQPVYVRSSIQPIVAAIAARRHVQGSPAVMDSNMPSRSHNSQCKIASWTRLRKQMEQPDAYKPPGVSEVLMVRKYEASDTANELELLEGLSSNVFVIYRDGTLRTAPNGVLFGYVRQMVLECAPACGLKLDSNPVLLGHVDQWREVFITSSSRLIYPISQILIHAGEGQDFEEFWSDSAMKVNPSSDEAGWRKLLDEILRRNGY